MNSPRFRFNESLRVINVSFYQPNVNDLRNPSIRHKSCTNKVCKDCPSYGIKSTWLFVVSLPEDFRKKKKRKRKNEKGEKKGWQEHSA